MAYGHTTTVAEILKAVTKVIAQEKQNLLLKNIITKEISDRTKALQKVTRFRVGKTLEVNNQKRQRRQVYGGRMICPNHGDFLQQKKYIKDPIEIHNIKQKDVESTEEFVRRYKLECNDVKGAPECMKISEAKLQEGRLPEPTKVGAKAGQGEDGTEGPMIIEAEMGGHFVHRMYMDGGSSSEILYDDCFNRFRPGTSCREHETSATLRNAMCMKCKHPSHAR
ncbi:hypothetical protein Tco_1040524 [Tanacetum coccineum]